MTNIQYTKEKRQLNTTQLFFFPDFLYFLNYYYYLILLSSYSASVLSLWRPVIEQMWVVHRDGGLPSQVFNYCK